KRERASKWGRSLADGNVREEVGHRLAVVRATNGLGENHRNIDALDLGALLHVVLLRDRVRHHDRLEGRVVQAGEGGATEDAVDAERVHLLCARLDQLVGGEADGATGVGHVIDQDGDLQMDVSDERHLLDLVGALALLVDEGEVDVEAVGDRRHSLRSSRIRRHDHGALPVGNALLDVLEDGGLGVEVVPRGMSKKPWIWDACRSIVMMWSAPATGEHVGDLLAEMGRARLVLLVLARVRGSTV
ncbi:hypothetical protein PENTCL1PPCAC_30422, partial [Pristionchus entomophagus]